MPEIGQKDLTKFLEKTFEVSETDLELSFNLISHSDPKHKISGLWCLKQLVEN